MTFAKKGMDALTTALTSLKRQFSEPEKWASRKARARCCADKVTPCNDHRFFKCPHCRRWTPWSKGCADDMPEACDDCWAKLSLRRTT